MSIFTRTREIIASNINAMLDKAEDPEKLVALMIQDMEDTLVEIKASCAEAMAAGKRIQRDLAAAEARTLEWARKAQLAVDKGRDDLAREALAEKRRYVERAKALEAESAQWAALVEQHKADIIELEGKMATARERQKAMGQRRARPRPSESRPAVPPYDKVGLRLESIEAQERGGDRAPALEEEFAKLLEQEEIEKELAALKAKRPGA